MKRNVHIVVCSKTHPFFSMSATCFTGGWLTTDVSTSAADPHHWMDLDPNPTNAAPVSRHLTRFRGGPVSSAELIREQRTS